MRKTNYIPPEQKSWMDWTAKNLPAANSDTPIMISDLDCIIRSKPNFDGTTCIKLLELKSKLSVPSKAQRITFALLNKILRKADGTTLEVEGLTLKIQYHGFHLLQFSNTSPSNSEKIFFDKRLVSENELIFNLSWGCCSNCF